MKSASYRSVWTGAAMAAGICAAAGMAHAQGKLEIVTLPAGSVAHGAATGIASIVSQKSDLKVLAVPFAGPQKTVPMVNSGQAAFTLLNVNDTSEAFIGGNKAYRNANKNLRLVAVGYENRVAVLGLADAKISKPEDLKGKRAAGIYSSHKTCGKMATALLANLGLTWKDVKVVPVTSVVPGVRALGEGRADIVPCAALGMGAVREVNARKKVQFISGNPSAEAVKAAREHFVGLRAVKTKAGATEGVINDTVVFHYDFYLLAGKSVSDDVVYKMVKTVYENVDDLQKTHRALRSWTQARMAGDGDVTAPFHPGAIKFYKEKGLWKDVNDKRTQELLKK